MFRWGSPRWLWLLSALFAADMVVKDAADSVLIVRVYGLAFIKPTAETLVGTT
jgi:high-affinity nickel permease